MKKSFKKVVAVVSAIAMVVASFANYQTKSVSAADTISTEGGWINLSPEGYDRTDVGGDRYQIEGISAIYAGHWGDQTADIDITRNDEDPYTMDINVINKQGFGAWLTQIAINVQNLDDSKAYIVTLKSDEDVLYSTMLNDATEYKVVADVTSALTVGQHTLKLTAEEYVDDGEEVEVQDIKIIPNEAQIAETYKIWANWDVPEGATKVYAYLGEVAEGKDAATAGNGWIFNEQAVQPMNTLDQVAQTKDGSIKVEMGETYKLIVEAYNVFNKKVGYGEIDITIPTPDVIGGDVEFTNSYREDTVAEDNTYYALFANWKSVPGAAGYKSYINEVAEGKEAMAANGWVWSDQNGGVGSGDLKVDTVYRTKDGTIYIDENTAYTLIVIANDSKGEEIGRGTIEFPGKGGSEDVETTTEEESVPEETTTAGQGSDDPYADLDWVTIDDNYSVALVGYPAENNIQYGVNQVTELYVAMTAATVKPDYKAMTVNGTPTDARPGANFWVPVSMLNDNAYNTIVITDAVGTDYTFIIKAGTPSGEGEVTTEEASSEEPEVPTEESTSETEAQVLDAPVGVTYAGDDVEPYLFAWAASNGATGYNVYVNGELAATVTDARANLDAKYFPTAGEYRIEVTALNEAGESAKSVPYVYTVESQGNTYTVSVDGQNVAEVAEGETYTLPTDAQYGYFEGDNLYKAGATITVNGDISLTSLNSVSVTMANGAVVKNVAPAGIAFQAAVTVNGGTDLVESSFVSEGMLITANDLFVELGGSELTLESAYTYKDVTNDGWFDGTTGTYRAGITNVSEDNYIRKFIARGYVQLTYTDGDVETVYSEMSPVRSIQQVAQAAVGAGQGNEFLQSCAAAE